jgi:signal transduction histidine kinase
VKELAEGMGGSVSATSGSGRPTRFELRLPDAEAPALVHA